MSSYRVQFSVLKNVMTVVTALCLISCSMPSTNIHITTSLASPLTTKEARTAPSFNKALNDLKGYLKSSSAADPFNLEGETFSFDWCTDRPRRNKSLKDLVTRLEEDSQKARNFAQLYVITGSYEAFSASLDIILAWAKDSTLLNTYHWGVDHSSSSFPGMEEGFCNRSWNMMLDSIWQTYGLINFSEAYSMLANSGYAAVRHTDIQTVRSWIANELGPAVNSGFHVWTKFADTHPLSAAYERYRSDNHLSWCLAGLATAGLALNDKALLDYVYYGTAYDDGVSGPYENPSSLIKLIPFAVKSTGEIYDESVRASQHKGFFYGNFSLWALVITAINTEKAGYPPIWEKEFTENSGSIASALDRYAPYVANELTIKDIEEKTKPEFFSFVYRLILPMDWVREDRKELYRSAAMTGKSQNIRQGLGSIDLITELPPKTVKN